MKYFVSLLLLVGLLAPAPSLDAKTLYGRGSKQDVSVELFITSWCPYCRKAEAFLTANGIPFVAYDIEKDAEAARRKKRLDSRKGVPLVVINGQVLYGFSERIYRTALDLDD